MLIGEPANIQNVRLRMRASVDVMAQIREMRHNQILAVDSGRSPTPAVGRLRHWPAVWFGIIYGGATARAPFATDSYYPAYLLPSKGIEIVQGLSLEEPAIFWIPSLSGDRARPAGPTDHTAPVRDISRLSVGLPRMATLSHAARRVREAALLDFFDAPSPVLEVHFRSEAKTTIDCRPDLPLVFVGASSRPK